MNRTKIPLSSLFRNIHHAFLHTINKRWRLVCVSGTYLKVKSIIFSNLQLLLRYTHNIDFKKYLWFKLPIANLLYIGKPFFKLFNKKFTLQSHHGQWTNKKGFLKYLQIETLIAFIYIFYLLLHSKRHMWKMNHIWDTLTLMSRIET